VSCLAFLVEPVIRATMRGGKEKGQEGQRAKRSQVEFRVRKQLTSHR